MNFETLQAHVIRNLGNRDDLVDLAKSWINNAYLDFVTTGKLPELERFDPIPCPSLDETEDKNTEATVERINEPSNMVFPISLRDKTNNRPLLFRGIRWYDRHKSISNGQPRVYARYGEKIYLDPTPDAIYIIQIRFRAKVAVDVLVEAKAIPVIAPEFHEILEFMATYRGAMSLNRGDAPDWLDAARKSMFAHSEQGTEEEEDANIGFEIKM